MESQPDRRGADDQGPRIGYLVAEPMPKLVRRPLEERPPPAPAEGLAPDPRFRDLLVRVGLDPATNAKGTARVSGAG